MTLGIFTDDFHPHIGGLGRYVCEITSRLPEEKLLIFSPCDNTISNHVRVRPPFHQQFRNLSFSFWLHRNINETIEKYRLSRINIQCGPGGLFLLKQPTLPVVATCHHTWWQQSHYIKSQFWKKMFVPFEKRTYRLADKIICDSEDSKNVLRKYYGISGRKIVVIPIGVDTDKFYPLDNSNKIPCSLLYIGRIDKRKGIDFLINAMPAVTRKLPQATLFVGGTGKDAAKLKERVKAAGIEKNVKFLGFIAEEKLNIWYNKVQCVVVPSMFEGFGLTAIESMAAGTCLIATNVDSLKNIVDDGVDGYLVDYGDIESLSSRIIYLLNDPSERNKICRRAKEKVETVFNWDRIMKHNLKELYSLP